MNLSFEHARMIDGGRRHPARRAKLIELSLAWQRRQDERRAELAEAIRRTAIKHVASEPEKTRFSADPMSIISMVAVWHGVEVADIRGSSRVRPVIEARMDAIAAVYVNCLMGSRPYSLSEMGRLFRRDHTTILHALRKRGVK